MAKSDAAPQACNDTTAVQLLNFRAFALPLTLLLFLVPIRSNKSISNVSTSNCSVIEIDDNDIHCRVRSRNRCNDIVFKSIPSIRNGNVLGRVKFSFPL